MAGLGGGGEDNRQPPAGRPPQRREPVLSAEPGIHAGAVQPHRPGTLGHREPAALVLDVVFNEDQSRNRKEHCPDNLALLRKLALNLARLEPSKGSIRGKLKRAGWGNDCLVTILSQFTKIQMR